MQYKTITLELIRDHPALHDRLKQNRLLMTFLDMCATELKDRHQAWQEELRLESPEVDPIQRQNRALELAVEDLRDHLACASEEDTDDRFPLDGAMAYLKRHTPPG